MYESAFGVLELYPIDEKFVEIKKHLDDYMEYIRNFYLQSNHNVMEHNEDIREFNKLPWYKKMFRELDECKLIEFCY